jgi:hypothetical protein
MAKRFIDTAFFKDPFVRGLQGACKGLYIYLFLDCSNAGLWDVELDVARLRCGVPDSVTDEDIKLMFADKIIEVHDGQKWLIKNFLKLQHNSVLKENNRAHTSAIEELKKFDLITEKEKGIYVLKDLSHKPLARGIVRGYGNGKSIGNGNGKSNGIGNSKSTDYNFNNEDSEKKSKTDLSNDELQQVVDVFNQVCTQLPEVQKLTLARKKTIQARVNEYGTKQIGALFRAVSKSDFLNGKGEKGWVADFDWIMNPNNFIKILEGRYNGKTKSNTKSSVKYSDEFLRKVAGKFQS